MANITIPRKEFEKEIKLTKVVEEKISLFGTPLEKINEEEIEVEIFPNRPDLLSTHGFLRGFKAFLGKEQGLKKYAINPPEKDYKVKISPSVKNIRPFTACAIVKNLRFDDEKIKEIIELQEKLHSTVGRNRKKIAIGIYPLEKITLPIKYEARKPKEIKFIPLEAQKEMDGLQILQRHPAGRDYAHLLEGKDKFPIFVDAKNKILSMPPIINSHETGKVTHETKDVFVECSGFDFQILKKTLNIIITTLAEMSGKIYQMTLEYEKPVKTPDLTPEKMKINIDNINSLIGLNLKESDLSKLLPKMGLNYSRGQVEIPAWRTDILHEVDIAEDIAIAYGYDKLIPILPSVATIGEESKENRIKRKLSEIIAGLNLMEISTYHLIKSAESNSVPKEKLIEVENSKTEYKILRPNLLIPALRILTENKDNEYPQKLFEIGTVFSPDKDEETGIKETTNLLVISSPANFTELKQILDYLTRILGVSYSLEESIHPDLIEGRTAEIKINELPVGYLGEVHPETLRQWGIKMPASVLEISLEEIFKILED